MYIYGIHMDRIHVDIDIDIYQSINNCNSQYAQYVK